MRHHVLLASLAFAAGVTPAAAIILPVDTFVTAQGPVSDGAIDGTAVAAEPVNYVAAGHAYTRALATNLVATGILNDNRVQVVGGLLDVRNGTGDGAVVTVSYTLPASIDAVILAQPLLESLSFQFAVVGVDLSAVSFTGNLNGVDLGIPMLIAGNPTRFRFTMPLGMVSGDYTMTIAGAPGYDVTVDSLFLLINEDDGTVAPAPGALALLGLGIVAVAASRRR